MVCMAKIDCAYHNVACVKKILMRVSNDYKGNKSANQYICNTDISVILLLPLGRL